MQSTHSTHMNHAQVLRVLVTHWSGAASMSCIRCECTEQQMKMWAMVSGAILSAGLSAGAAAATEWNEAIRDAANRSHILDWFAASRAAAANPDETITIRLDNMVIDYESEGWTQGDGDYFWSFAIGTSGTAQQWFETRAEGNQLNVCEGCTTTAFRTPSEVLAVKQGDSVTISGWVTDSDGGTGGGNDFCGSFELVVPVTDLPYDQGMRYQAKMAADCGATLTFFLTRGR
jgi:hypothetical protein